MRTDDFDTVIEAFDRLEAAVIDTSSIILTEKAGFLSLLAGSVCLHTIPAVAAEYAARGAVLPAGISLMDLPHEGSLNAGPLPVPTAGIGVPADSGVLAAARRKKLPLISEDRKLLLRADTAGLVYYNALVMIEFLLYRKALSPAACEDRRAALTAAARYSPRVLAWAEGLHWAVVKRG